MHTQGVIRDATGAVQVDLSYIRSNLSWYEYEYSYVIGDVTYYQYRQISNTKSTKPSKRQSLFNRWIESGQ